MTTSLPARCPAPVAPLPPRGSRRTGTFSMPITGTFYVPIDTLSQPAEAATFLARFGPVTGHEQAPGKGWVEHY